MDHLTVSTIINALPFPAAATDPDLRILAVNPPGRALFGSETGAGSPVAEPVMIVPQADRAQFDAAVSALLALDPAHHPSPSITFEARRKTPDAERARHITVTPLRGSDGGNDGFLFFSRESAALPDESGRREQEAARMDVARQLAATMNHEVNNPLFVVSATLEDLLAEIDDPAEQRRLNAALDAVWRVSSAVKKLSEIRQLVSTAYIDGFPMIDLDASQVHPGE